MPNSKKKRQFIDKKNAVSFHLVHRSQRDPLIADGDAPQNVLVESHRDDDDDRREDRHRQQPGRMNVDPSLTVDPLVTRTTVKSKRKEEQAKYGVFYDDDYDYLQHLKIVGETCLEPAEGFTEIKRTTTTASREKKDGRLNLPSSLFPSEIEDNVGLLNRAAPCRGPRPELDPDVLEALESDYSDCEGSEGSFDDDFVQKANLPDDNDNEDDSNGSSEEDSFNGTFNDEETKSRFTHYSMSSSVIRRNDGLTLLDDRFEKIFEEYDDEQIGPLDGDCADGYLTTGDPLIESVIEDFTTMQAERFHNGVIDLPQEEDRKVDSMSEEDESNDDDEQQTEHMVKILLDTKPSEKWDCESILSTYSTLYNHPRVIKEPQKVKKITISTTTGIPRHVLDAGALTKANLKALDDISPRSVSSATVTSKISSTRDPAIFTRSKEETLEEKRERKRLVKLMRQERRVEKKANKTAFKEEKKKQEKVQLNVEQNFKGVKLR